MIKLIIGWYVINLIFFIIFLSIKVIERKKEKREEQQKDYREVTIQPSSKRIPFLGVFVNDM